MDGGDHLLLVKKSGYRESSKRFFYRDIQAIICTETPTAFRINLFCTVSFVLIAVFFITLGANGVLSANSAAIGGIIGGGSMLLFLMLNLLYGPTCDCVVHTAVQAERLLPITRLRKARRLLPQIRKAVEEAQGSLSAETPFARLRGEQPIRRTFTGSAPLVYDTGNSHLLAFGLLIAQGFLSFAVFDASSALSGALARTVFSLVVSVAMLVALIRQRKSTIPHALQTYTWTVFVLINGINFIVIGYVNVLISLRLPFPGEALSPLIQPAFFVTIITAGVFWALGIAGITSVLFYRLGTGGPGKAHRG